MSLSWSSTLPSCSPSSGEGEVIKVTGADTNLVKVKVEKSLGMERDEDSSSSNNNTNSNNTLARAFVLDTDSEWVTVATGVTVLNVAADESSLMVSLNDEGEVHKVLFSTTFHRGQDITRQQATVVTWTLGDGSDVALSFENEAGCDSFWKNICKFLGRLPHYTPHEDEREAQEQEEEETRDRSREEEDEEEEEERYREMERERDERARERERDGKGGSDQQMIKEEPIIVGGRNSPTIILPKEVDFKTIADIEEAIEQANQIIPSLRRALCEGIMEQNYIGKLLELFKIAEDLEARETLYRLYRIFKNLFFFNYAGLLRELLEDGNIFHVAGVFEWNPSYPPDARPGYRQFLKDPTKFRQLLQLGNAELIELIHQTFRIQYFKDVILVRTLNDDSYYCLTAMVTCNFADILELLEGDEDFMVQLTPLFKSLEAEECETVLKFMKEFLTIAKAATGRKNLRFYQTGAFGELLRFLRRMLDKDVALDSQILATDIIIIVTQNDPGNIRTFMIEERNTLNGTSSNSKVKGESGGGEQQLLTAIIDRVIDPTVQIGLRWELVAVLRVLLDSAGPLGLTIQNDDFLNFFYPDYALRLLNPLVEFDKVAKRNSQHGAGAGGESIFLTAAEADLYFNCCELLCSFILQHKYRIKYLLFRSFIIHNSLLLLHCQDRYLRLCAVRIVHTMIDTGDDFYFRLFIKQSLLKPIIEATIAQGEIDNAMSSSLFELFYSIRDKRYKLLISHLVETFKGELERIRIGPIYQELLKCYNDLNNPQSDRQRGGGATTLTPEEYHNCHSWHILFCSRELEEEQLYGSSSSSSKSRDTWLGVDRSEEAYFSSAQDDEDDDEGEGEGENLTIRDVDNDYTLDGIPNGPDKMATTWRPEDDLDCSKRMKY